MGDGWHASAATSRAAGAHPIVDVLLVGAPTASVGPHQTAMRMRRLLGPAARDAHDNDCDKDKQYAEDDQPRHDVTPPGPRTGAAYVR
jgi:hypothetical protein